MIDIVNYQFRGYPILMYGMMIVTIGALTYATVGNTQITMPSLPSFPSSSETPTPSQGMSIPGLGTPQETPLQNTLTKPSVGGKSKRKHGKSKHTGSKKNNRLKK